MKTHYWSDLPLLRFIDSINAMRIVGGVLACAFLLSPASLEASSLTVISDTQTYTLESSSGADLNETTVGDGWSTGAAATLRAIGLTATTRAWAGGPSNVVGGGHASFSDSIIVDSPGLTGHVAFITFYANFTSTMDFGALPGDDPNANFLCGAGFNIVADAAVISDLGHSDPGKIFQFDTTRYRSSGEENITTNVTGELPNGLLSGTVPFVLGQDIVLGMSIVVGMGSQVSSGSPAGTTAHVGVEIAGSWYGFHVTDENGQSLPFSAVAPSGIDYSIPEPSSAILLTAGRFALLLSRFRKPLLSAGSP